MSTLGNILMTTYSTTSDGAGGFLAFGLFTVLIYAAIIGFSIWVYVRILNKLGYSGWWVLLCLVPFGAIVGMCLLAFKKTPIEEKLERLEQYARQGSGSGALGGSQPYQAPSNAYQSPYGTNNPQQTPNYGQPQQSSQGFNRPPQGYGNPQPPQGQRYDGGSIPPPPGR